jgi:hypothetical protein
MTTGLPYHLECNFPYYHHSSTLPPWPCSILNKLLSIRHRNKVNPIWSATQIKAKKTKKKVLLTYTGSVQLWRSSLRERESAWAKEAFSKYKEEKTTGF